MSRDEMVELATVVVAIVVVLVLVVFFVHRPALGATTQPTSVCWQPSIEGKTVQRGKDAAPLHFHGDCMRLMVASVVSACEQHEGEDRASCYSYFLRPGRVECKPAECSGPSL